MKQDFAKLRIETELDLGRQWFAAPLDNSWQTGPRLILGYAPSRAADFTAGYQWTRSLFDTRETVDLSGAAIAGTHLRFDTQTADLGWHQVWDAKRRWDTSLKGGMEFIQDNGSAYFDYRQYHLIPRVKYHADTWEIALQLQAGYYEFPNQTVSSSNSNTRRKVVLTAGLRAEKTVWKKLKVFADYSFDDSLSDTTDDNYRANSTSAGLEWQF